MNVRMRFPFAASLAIASTTIAGVASAQTFPADNRYAPLPCGDGVMVDGYRDQPGAFDERDIVGDVVTAAGFHASDANFAYLRMRVDQDPAPSNKPQPYEWGFEFDLDGNRSTYELLIIFRGTDGTLAVHTNKTTTLPDDPNDPADDPPVATYPFATNVRTVVAAGSLYGGANDYFLDVAVPWSVLEPLGVKPTTPLTVWAATSTNATSLNGDFACHDGGSGAPHLSGIPVKPTVIDPAVDTDGDGFSDASEVAAGTDPNNAASHPSGSPTPLTGPDPVLEGAGGCTLSLGAPTTPGLAILTLAGVFGLVVRRRKTERRS